MTPWRATSWLHRHAGHESYRTRRVRTIVGAVRDAWQRGDSAALARALTRDAALLVDSGGRVPVQVRRAAGADAAAAALMALGRSLSVTSIHDAEVNGAPGLVLRAGERVVGVIAFTARGRAVSLVWAVVNPEKLTHWNG